MTCDTIKAKIEALTVYSCHGWDIRRGDMKPDDEGEGQWLDRDDVMDVLRSSVTQSIDVSEFPDLPPETRVSIRIIDGEMAGTEIDNVPFSALLSPAPSNKMMVNPVAWFFDFVSDIPRSINGYRPTLTALTEKEPTPGPNVFNIRPLYEHLTPVSSMMGVDPAVLERLEHFSRGMPKVYAGEPFDCDKDIKADVRAVLKALTPPLVEKEEEKPTGCHPSHVLRYSDASTYDVVCTLCGETDKVPGGWGNLVYPCRGKAND